MNYVGIDYHKKYSHVTAIDEEGSVIRSRRLGNNPEVFQEFFKRLEGASETVLEASRTWGVMYDLLEDLEEVESVQLAHPLKVRAIAEAKIKTDKIDSHILAQLLRADLIPAAYIPGKETRSFKEMIRQRIFLVRMRTRLKNGPRGRFAGTVKTGGFLYPRISSWRSLLTARAASGIKMV